ncbi:MAG: glycosyltransferase [Oscillospiraceae bacterium]
MNILISSVLCFLSVYGAMQLIFKCMALHTKAQARAIHSTHIVLSVKNQEDTIEGVIRAIAWEPCDGEIVVIDLGSDDDTPKILHKLEREYDFLHCMTKSEYLGFIESI